MSMASPAILSNFFEERWTQNHPQYLSGLPRASFPATFLEIAVYGTLWAKFQPDQFLIHLFLYAGVYCISGRRFSLCSQASEFRFKILSWVDLCL